MIFSNRSISRRPIRAAHSLGFFLILSVILHITGFVPVIIEKILPEPSPVSTASMEVLTEEDPEIKAALLEQQRESTESLLKSALENIAGEVDPETFDQLWQEMEMDFSQMEWPEIDSLDSLETYNQLTAEMFEQAAGKLEEMLRQDLKNATLEQAQEFSTAKLAKHLEQSMEEQLGTREAAQNIREAKKETAQRHQELKKDLKNVKRKIDQAAQQQKSLAEHTAKTEQSEATAPQRKRAAKSQQSLQKQVGDLSQDLQELSEKFSQELSAKPLPAPRLAEAQNEQTEALNKLKQETASSENMQKATEALQQGSQELSEILATVTELPEVDLQARQSMKALVDQQLKSEIQQSFDETLTSTLAPQGAEILTRQAQEFFEEFGMEADPELEAQLKEALTEMIGKSVPELMKDQAGQLAMNKTEAALKLDEIQAAEKAAVRANAAAKTQAQQAQVSGEVAKARRAVDLGDMSGRMEEIKAKHGMKQRAEAMAESFREGRGDLGALGNMMAAMGTLQEGQGKGNLPPGASLPFGLPIPGGPGAFNVDVFNQLLEMSAARNDPEAVYPELEKQAEKLVNRAGEFPELRPVKMIDPEPEGEEKADEPEREVIPPAFNPLKFGWATMVREKPVLDGQLDEWEMDRAQYVSMWNRGTENPVELPEEASVKMAMQWDHDGLYIAAVVPNDSKAAPSSASKFWEGDSIEAWLDTSELRGPLMTYYEAIQMWWHPYPSKNNPEMVAGFSHGYRMDGKPGARAVFRRDQQTGLQMGMRETSGGYTVELFIPQEKVLKGPKFRAGKYLGFQISFNHVRGDQSLSWVMRGHHSWERPDTWGDLLLMGSDAEISFFKDDALENSLDVLLPGEPFRIKLHDPDMNLDPRYKDQLIVQVTGAFGHSETVVLGETEINNGIFSGGVETNNIYTGYRKGFLPVKPGAPLTVKYLDQRRDYGETNLQVKKNLPSAWPTYRISTNP